MNTVKRLTKYLELVRINIKGTSGEIQEFWKREELKTARKIASLQ